MGAGPQRRTHRARGPHLRFSGPHPSHRRRLCAKHGRREARASRGRPRVSAATGRPALRRAPHRRPAPPPAAGSAARWEVRSSPPVPPPRWRRPRRRLRRPARACAPAAPAPPRGLFVRRMRHRRAAMAVWRPERVSAADARVATRPRGGRCWGLRVLRSAVSAGHQSLLWQRRRPPPPPSPPTPPRPRPPRATRSPRRAPASPASSSSSTCAAYTATCCARGGCWPLRRRRTKRPRRATRPRLRRRRPPRSSTWPSCS